MKAQEQRHLEAMTAIQAGDEKLAVVKLIALVRADRLDSSGLADRVIQAYQSRFPSTQEALTAGHVALTASLPNNLGELENCLGAAINDLTFEPNLNRLKNIIRIELAIRNLRVDEDHDASLPMTEAIKQRVVTAGNKAEQPAVNWTLILAMAVILSVLGWVVLK